MKNSIFKSFRFEIIIYSLLSLLYSVLTVSVILFAVVLLYSALDGNQGVKKDINQYSNQYAVEQYKNAQRDDTQQAPQNYQNGYAINNPMNNSALYQGRNEQYFNTRKSFVLESNVLIVGMIFSVILGVIFFILYFLKLTKKFATYIETIASGITEISHGNFSSRISIDSKDEFSVISEKINGMANDIEQIMKNRRSSEVTKNELITSVAHDLRTPLTSIIGYLDLVSKRELDQETKEKYIEIAYSKSKRLEQLIEDLFSYTKCNDEDMALQYENVDIVKLLEQLLDEFYPSFEENHLEYEFFKDCSSLCIQADGNLLARAFANLIGNAIKYGSDGKRIELQLRRGITNIQVDVRNYGELIPTKDIEHVFDRFYRVESSRSQETGGSGLGLAIAKNIINMHKGEIHAKSDFEGTVFEVTLPIDL